MKVIIGGSVASFPGLLGKGSRGRPGDEANASSYTLPHEVITQHHGLQMENFK